jgi:hypothetical protein
LPCLPTLLLKESPSCAKVTCAFSRAISHHVNIQQRRWKIACHLSLVI